MAITQSTQTHPKFLWRFIRYPQNQAFYHSIIADTEQQARIQLPSGKLVFVARIRQEVRHG